MAMAMVMEKPTLGEGEGVRVEPLSLDDALLPRECLRDVFTKLGTLSELLGDMWEDLGYDIGVLLKGEAWS